MNLARSGSALISAEAGHALLLAHADWKRHHSPGTTLAYHEALADAAQSVEIRRRIAHRLAARVKPEQQQGDQGVKLTWSVLPPGRRIVDHIMSRDFVRTDQGRYWDRERLALLDNLKPLKWYEGAHLGRTVYFVAVFERVAIADTPEWGNALYYCANDQGRWQSVFRLEKQAAVAAGAKRIIHVAGWEAQVRRLVERREPDKGESSHR